mmetsp:Transcript_45191/g.116936  ORF Transcript_45191/g.116936 Transcript_45191/m.116936 type:complete len:89 (-) Transcript_45191:2101-2367(-)
MSEFSFSFLLFSHLHAHEFEKPHHTEKLALNSVDEFSLCGNDVKGGGTRQPFHFFIFVRFSFVAVSLAIALLLFLSFRISSELFGSIL